MQANGSEVAAIRAQIATEYMAARLGLQGLNTGTSRHEFITAKQERVGILHEELQELVGDEAIALVAETVDNLPDHTTRSAVLTVLQHELGNSVETEHLCDHLQEMWETIDMLIERFGMEQAQKIMLAPFSSLVQETLPL